MSRNTKFDVVVIGAGAAGMMCAIEVGKRGRSVLLLEKADKVGKKILISGGGRCNFTNVNASPDKYVSENMHFCKSALRQYDQRHFISLVEKYHIAYHEKKLGQLFCDSSATEITDMLEQECKLAGVVLWLEAGVSTVETGNTTRFDITVGTQRILAETVVVATGGLSIPKMGANDFAHRLANKWGLELTETRPGLAPLTFEQKDMDRFNGLTGISADVIVKTGKTSFRENVLFTHRGVSGPAILQISSFWTDGEKISIDFLPDHNISKLLKEERSRNPKSSVHKFLSQFLANRLLDRLLEKLPPLPEFGNCSDKHFDQVIQSLKYVDIRPNGTEGYRKAEVTVGGVSTRSLSSKTMEAKKAPGLFFIGEAVDVTGFLGGYNFQWAWSSGYVAGQYA